LNIRKNKRANCFAQPPRPTSSTS